MYRRDPQTVEEQIADIQRQLRRSQARQVESAAGQVPAAFSDKGDILLGTAPGHYVAAPVGTDGTVLTADSAAEGGASWQAPAPAVESILPWLAVAAFS